MDAVRNQSNSLEGPDAMLDMSSLIRTEERFGI